jgi:site-specific DNA recombinase
MSSQPSGPVVSAPAKCAVLYLRVSTPRQMHTAVDVDPEGNSIATQREACLAKAQNLDASVLAEFVEPGNSAQSIEKRPVFKQLLAYLEDHRDVDYVIVYMRSRAFRNSVDAAITKRALSMFGIRIVSCREDFGTGPVADAMETVADAFNELQVRQNGEDIRQKLRHKAMNGGTISRAKLGYLNIRAEHEGRLFNSIGLDEERAPLVRTAFELYATGDYSIDRLHAAMTDLGLRTRPSPRWPQAKPVSTSKLHLMLADPYYAGWVIVEGQLVPGRHAPIISQALFDRVQRVMAERSANGIRDRVLTHYLKGQLFCARCRGRDRTSRLIYTEARGRGGERYGYFLCRARQDGDCDLPYLPSSEVEDAVRRQYGGLEVGDDFIEAVRRELTETVSAEEQLTRERDSQLRAQLAKLEAREERLIDLAADGALTRAKIVERSNAIRAERVHIQAALADTSAELAVGAEHLRYCLELVKDPAGLYEDAPDHVRRQLNQAFYNGFELDADEDEVMVTDDELRPPFDEIRDAANIYRQRERYGRATSLDGPAARLAAVNLAERRRSVQKNGPDWKEHRPIPVLSDVFSVNVSSKRVLVELRGFEPLTPSMRTRCATGLRHSPLIRNGPKGRRKG